MKAAVTSRRARQRRGLVFALRCNGATFGEIAALIGGVSVPRARQIFLKAEAAVEKQWRSFERIRAARSAYDFRPVKPRDLTS